MNALLLTFHPIYWSQQGRSEQICFCPKHTPPLQSFEELSSSSSWSCTSTSLAESTARRRPAA